MGTDPPDVAHDLQCLTVKEVAALLRWSVRGVWRESALGEVGLSTFPRPLRMGGKRTRWRLREIESYLDRLGLDGKRGGPA